VASVFRLPLSHGNKQVSTHLKRIEAVEKDLKAMSETTVAKDEFTNLRAEARKLYDGLHIGSSSRLLRIGSLTSRKEFLDLRSHVWGIRGYGLSITNRRLIYLVHPEQDLQALSRKERSSVRLV